MKGWLRKRTARVPVLDRALDVQERFGELHGNYLAGAISLAAFLSLFPLLLMVLAVAGFVSAGSSTDIAGRIIGELGLSGDAADTIRSALETAEESRKGATAVGLVGLLWSSLGLVAALQYAYDQVWQVKERGVRDKLFGLLWLVGAAVLFVAAGIMTAALNFLPGPLASLGIVLAVLTDFALFMWTAKVLANRDVGLRNLVPGAILGAIGLTALKALGTYYVPRAVASSSALFGSIGVVFALLAWLLFFGRLVVWTAVLNVVLYERKRAADSYDR